MLVAPVHPCTRDIRAVDAHQMDIADLYFHGLKGQRRGEYSVRVTGNWGITWRMNGSDVVDINLKDYH